MAKFNPKCRSFVYFAWLGASIVIFHSFAQCAVDASDKAGDISSRSSDDESLKMLDAVEEASAKAAQAVSSLQQTQELEKSLSEESLGICQKMMELEASRAAMQSLYIKVVLLRPLAAAYRQSYARHHVTASNLEKLVGGIQEKCEGGPAERELMLQENTTSLVESGNELHEFTIKILDLLSEVLDILLDAKTQEVFALANIQDANKLLTDAADQCQKTISTILNRKSEEEKKAIDMSRFVVSTLVKLACKEQSAEPGGHQE